jgi:Zn-dependent peptidase ImmA (M78 family)/DNA-binding XRE family transcriptional regulator/uncharacterized protein YjiS (DUF1127 family)
MARTPEARVAPALLTWAREDLGLGQGAAAKKIGVPEERLASWEAGEARPSIAQLRKAASIYKRPLAVFYLPEPPRAFRALSDFRRLPDAKSAILSPELRLAIRRARSQREALIELREMTDEPLADAPRLDEAHDEAETFGKAARALLDVPLVVQYEWPNEGRALNSWIAALEERDILVLHAQGVALSEMRGFSISAPKAPVIVLNGGDSQRGRIFTALHEFAHILLNDAGVCDLHDRRTANASNDVEVFCNRAAAAMLLPADALRLESRLAKPPRDGRWDDEDLRALADKYSVSQEVLLRRWFEMGLTNWDFLQAKRKTYIEAYRLQKEREATSTGGPSWYRIHVRDFGRSYIRTALDAYYRADITSSELSDYVEVKLNNLPKLEEELAKGVAA